MKSTKTNNYGGYSKEFCSLLRDYVRHKQKKHCKRFQFPEETSLQVKQSVKNFVKNHQIVISSKKEILIHKCHYYQQNKMNHVMTRVTKEKYLRLNGKCSQNIYYKSDHLVKLLKKREEQKVFRKCHIVNGVHKGIYLF